MERNSEFLDNPRPEDEKIGELFYEEGTPFRMVNGKKVQQIEGKEDLNRTINRIRVSGMTPSEYLKSIYG